MCENHGSQGKNLFEYCLYFKWNSLCKFIFEKNDYNDTIPKNIISDSNNISQLSIALIGNMIENNDFQIKCVFLITFGVLLLPETKEISNIKQNETNFH